MTHPDGPDRNDDQATAIRKPSDTAAPGQSRFTPGTMLADRFRIVALLGKGGMGEVYRAEDVRLGQQVALKFLPAHLASDPEKLSRLYGEVRLGRQVSHPNVCRLYDLSEFEGNYFISMEYIDGEDLASLLRRIGKLPHDKALDIARDLCAGLAAAHGLGVIHRDLRPANVMIDGRGTARITDFGLAALTDDLARLREVSGTPAYMAPEQLHGGEVTHRTDLYALGLILYEMFTGKRRFEARTMGEVIAQHESSRSHSLSQDTKDIDPAVQRIILRCLEEKPEARPPSIHAVIAALPGGDPLQAAIDAGETPSPEMVAAAGAVGELRPARAWGLFLAAVLMMVLAAGLAQKTSLYGRVSFPKKPDVLVDRARSLLAVAGYADKPADLAYSFFWNDDYFEHGPKKGAERWDDVNRVRPSPVVFWYRDSPRELEAVQSERRVHPLDPPFDVSGMRGLELDPEGRLVWFGVVPPQFEESPSEPGTPDWSMFFREAGLDVASLRPASSKWSIPVDADRRWAWDGRYPEQPEVTVHIAAASYHGRPVWFSVIPPWQQPHQMGPPQQKPFRKLAELFSALMLAVVIVAAIFLARRHLRRSRGDRKGAFRFAIFLLAATFLARTFRVDHVSSLTAEWGLIIQLLSEGLFLASVVWLTYIALEPYLRRRWPHMMISWSRLLAGRYRDPLVGRHLLIGMFAGATVALLGKLMVLAPTWLGMPALSPTRTFFTALTQLKHLIYLLLSALRDGAGVPFITAFVLLLLHLLVRKRAMAIVVLAAIFTFASPINVGENLPVEFSFSFVIALIMIGTLVRFGLLAFGALYFVGQVLSVAPLTLDTTVWYFGRSFAVLALLCGTSFYAFWASLADQPLFSLAALEEE